MHRRAVARRGLEASGALRSAAVKPARNCLDTCGEGLLLCALAQEACVHGCEQFLHAAVARMRYHLRPGRQIPCIQAAQEGQAAGADVRPVGE